MGMVPPTDAPRVSGVVMGEPVMLAEAKQRLRRIAEDRSWAIDDVTRLDLVQKVDDVLGWLFAETASVLATPPVRRDLEERPPAPAIADDDVVMALAEAIAKQSDTIALQADAFVALGRLVRAGGGPT